MSEFSLKQYHTELADGEYAEDCIGTRAFLLVEQAMELEAEGHDMSGLKRVLQRIDDRQLILSEALDQLFRQKYGKTADELMLELVESLADEEFWPRVYTVWYEQGRENLQVKTRNREQAIQLKELLCQAGTHAWINSDRRVHPSTPMDDGRIEQMLGELAYVALAGAAA